jgi:hypothetical protein
MKPAAGVGSLQFVGDGAFLPNLFHSVRSSLLHFSLEKLMFGTGLLADEVADEEGTEDLLNLTSPWLVLSLL